jgi:hypothetical protein
MLVQTNVHELRNWCEIQVRQVGIAIGYWLSTDVWATSWEPNAFKSATGHLHGLSARDTYFRKSFLPLSLGPIPAILSKKMPCARSKVPQGANVTFAGLSLDAWNDFPLTSNTTLLLNFSDPQNTTAGLMKVVVRSHPLYATLLSGLYLRFA